MDSLLLSTWKPWAVRQFRHSSRRDNLQFLVWPVHRTFARQSEQHIHIYLLHPFCLLFSLFIILAPCQWGSYPDSHAYKLFIILQYDGQGNGVYWKKKQHLNPLYQWFQFYTVSLSIPCLRGSVHKPLRVTMIEECTDKHADAKFKL